MNWKIIRIVDTWLGIPLLFLTAVFHWKRRAPAPAPVRRMLLIKFWGIGNIFMILPSLQALRAAHPDAAIDFLTLESNRDAVAALGVADEVVTIATDSLAVFFTSWRRGVARLKKKRYDIIVDFEQFARFSAFVANEVGAPRTVGFDTAGQRRSRLLTDAVPYDNGIHITRSFFALVVAAGAARRESLPAVDFPRLEAVRQQGAELLVQCGLPTETVCIVMHIGTSDNFRERRWLPERYALLADRLHEEFQARVLFTGLAEESFLIRETMGHVRNTPAVTDLGGKIGFGDYLALIAAVDLVVSADTAAVHMASAVDTPVVALYGPNTPLLYGPWGTQGLGIYERFDCSPCITNFNAKLHICDHPAGRGACMQAIEADDTLEAIRRHYFAPDAPCRLRKLEKSDHAPYRQAGISRSLQ